MSQTAKRLTEDTLTIDTSQSETAEVGVWSELVSAVHTDGCSTFTLQCVWAPVRLLQGRQDDVRSFRQTHTADSEENWSRCKRQKEKFNYIWQIHTILNSYFPHHLICFIGSELVSTYLSRLQPVALRLHSGSFPLPIARLLGDVCVCARVCLCATSMHNFTFRPGSRPYARLEIPLPAGCNATLLKLSGGRLIALNFN